MWHAFQIILDAPDALTGGFAELAERMAGGVDADAPLASRDGVVYVDVYREAPTLEEVVDATLTELAALGIGAVRVGPGPLVTATEIAERLGVSRQAVQTWVAGTRGNGAFPAPMIGLESRIRLWRWADVLRWLGDRPDELAAAQTIARVNHRLEGLRLAV